jgi:hypothetical protein
MRKAFPDKELKQPKKQDVVVENNNINNMEDDNMEQVNKLFDKYELCVESGNEEAAYAVKEELNNLGYDVVYNAQEDIDTLVELNNNDNNEEEVVMENIAVIKCDNACDLYPEVFMNEQLQSMATLLDENTIVVNLDLLDETSANIIGYELDYRQKHMAESYPNLTMENFKYNRRRMMATALLAPAFSMSQQERYAEFFEGFATKVCFTAYDAKLEMACVHFIVFDLEVGQEEELMKKLSTQNKIVKNVTKGVKLVDNTLTTAAFALKEMSKISSSAGKVGGALLETTAAIGTSVVSEVATSAVKSYNNIIEGKYVSRQTKNTFFSELARAKANTAKAKSLFVKEDKTYGDLF